MLSAVGKEVWREAGKEGRERGSGESQGQRREGERLHTKFHLNVFIVSASGDQNILINFDIGGLLHRFPLPMTTKFGALEQTHSIRLRAGRENPKILPFFGLRHFVVSPVGGSLRK